MKKKIQNTTNKKNNKNVVIIAVVALVSLVFIGTFVMSGYKVYELNKSLVEIDSTELREKIEDDEDFILVFTNTTCSHCAMYKPILQEVLVDYDLVAYEIVTDHVKEEDISFLNTVASISGTPTTVFIKDGEEIATSARIVGSSTVEKITSRLKAVGFISE